MEILSQAQLFEDKVSSLKAQLSNCNKTREDAISLATKQSRQTKMLEARFNLLEYKLELLKPKELTSRDMQVMRCKVADAKGDVKKLAGGLL